MFTLTPDNPLTFTGSADRYHKNIAAIKLLRSVQLQERHPRDLTNDEQRILAHYTAFGESQLLTRAIERDTEFADLTNQEERNHITRAALTAYYTPQDLLHVIWQALAPSLRQLTGTIHVLEPAFGIGMFAATMLLDIRQRSEITAVELDLVSSDIARLLHADVQVHGGIGFESVDLPPNHYDLVITNVPFNGNKVFFPGFKEDYLKRCLHDFFIARSIQLTRPGGIVCVLTSYGTMDKCDERTRQWIAERAELITALRLPQGAFEANSGTLCGADLLIFRRNP
jgi:adenine-specific DNA methylase